MNIEMGVAKTEWVRIEPARGRVALGLSELWRYRELLYFLTWKEVKVRYKQTLLGASWAILQPTLTMVVFTLFFGRLAGVPSDNEAYAVFSFTALLPWTLFANGIQTSSLSLVSSTSLVTRVYFPRLALPIAGVLSSLVDFFLAFGVLGVLMAYYGVTPTVNVIFVPLFLCLAVVTSLGVGLWLSALNVKYRDVRYILPFLIQLWLFATPVAYPSSLLDDPWRTIYGVNPMVGVVEGFRWSLLGTDTGPQAIVLISTVVSVLILLGGARFFRQTERQFADLV